MDIFTTPPEDAEESSTDTSLAGDISTDLFMMCDLPADDDIAHMAQNLKGPSGSPEVKPLRTNGKLYQDKDWGTLLTGDVAGEMYIDINGNPNSRKLIRGLAEKKCYDMVRQDSLDVDWKRNSNGIPKMLIPVYRYGAEALYGQRIGTAAPEGQECEQCRAGLAPFESCKVAVNKKGEPVFQGACMGCAFEMEHHA